MHVDEEKNMKDPGELEHLLARICEEKPLFIDIKTISKQNPIIKSICEQQQERGRYYWLDKCGGIKTNMIKQGRSVEHIRNAKLSMFVDAIKNDGRWHDNQVMLSHPE